jgi:pimeloyl-ACP methyl ester carboxylesterase
VVLVGHSYGGAVITEAGNDEKVAALVYIAAFAHGSHSIYVSQPRTVAELIVEAAGT